MIRRRRGGGEEQATRLPPADRDEPRVVVSTVSVSSEQPDAPPAGEFPFPLLFLHSIITMFLRYPLLLKEWIPLLILRPLIDQDSTFAILPGVLVIQSPEFTIHFH